MEEIIKLFKEYEPIQSIYENEENYYCFPIIKKSEPLVIIYNKEFRENKIKFFYEFPDLSNLKLIYGKDLHLDEDDEF